ncbi:hypothetical protein C8Q78DRAFT_993471 [Trametes maxima]|nr:hypothetical protein C8Q78DRAFT_993471 [Trametes maxima]
MNLNALSRTRPSSISFSLSLDAYFDSGCYWTAPGNVNAFSQMVWSACNSDNSFLIGVAVGTAFHVSMDANHYYDFSIGYTNPVVGAYKANVADGKDKGVDGYERVDSQGLSAMTRTIFEGKYKDGNVVKFKFSFSAVAGQEPLFIIKQVLV